MRFIVVAGVLGLANLSAAWADAPAFSTGRPGQTESPVAVPQGFVQVETEIAGVTRSRSSGVTDTETRALATTLRYGLGGGNDAELVLSPYVRQSGGGEANAGFGDVTVRLRHMLTGAGGAGPAVAVIGFVTAPTSKAGLGADKVEGGLIFTGAGALTHTLSLTGTLGAAAVHAAGYEGAAFGGANLTWAVTDAVGVYVEAFAEKAAHGDVAQTLDLGATLLVGATTQFDAGIDLGVSDAAPDANVFVGWSHRF